MHACGLSVVEHAVRHERDTVAAGESESDPHHFRLMDRPKSKPKIPPKSINIDYYFNVHAASTPTQSGILKSMTTETVLAFDCRAPCHIFVHLVLLGVDPTAEFARVQGLLDLIAA